MNCIWQWIYQTKLNFSILHACMIELNNLNALAAMTTWHLASLMLVLQLNTTKMKPKLCICILQMINLSTGRRRKCGLLTYFSCEQIVRTWWEIERSISLGKIVELKRQSLQLCWKKLLYIFYQLRAIVLGNTYENNIYIVLRLTDWNNNAH